MLKTYKNLNDLPSSSRVWVFPSTRVFSDEEIEKIQPQLDIFLFQWAAHGADLYAKGHILFNRFIVVMLDESKVMASGCSIDTLTHFIQKLEKEVDTSFTDRMRVNFINEDIIEDASINNFPSKINSESQFFNHLVTSKLDFENAWIIPVKGSWLERFL